MERKGAAAGRALDLARAEAEAERVGQLLEILEAADERYDRDAVRDERGFRARFAAIGCKPVC